MGDDTSFNNPFMASWMEAQAQLWKAQAPFWDAINTAAPDMGQTDEIWSKVLEQGKAMSRQLGAALPMAKADGIAAEVIERMFDPGQFVFAGSDEVNKTIQQLVDGSNLSDLASIERQQLKTTEEWLRLKEASSAYRVVTAKAWMRAQQRFAKEAGADPASWGQDAGDHLKRWLDIANEELIATQRTGDFLDAQRKLLRAGVDYKLRERELVEAWCARHAIPTRTEVDELHAQVHVLRRDMRRLKKAASFGKAQSKKPNPKAKGARS
ncbi:poly(R)-hydroxyalkanoic acid synthase subunit PhaE [Pacificoceanicola onchidii]|uniref:poly(R)-hydroxyalkanoic acid synthase subunit PhaE n=1 Tax=Pacificoceanicola onchidii TaxID=2562685 RepID=UPI0010A5D96F|nr:poly(R)-hydroxyalkanoic acid synthase subunit PhaE [Pacificoceanicola onchidii]